MKLKKTLTTIGVATLAISPMAAVISCGNSESSINPSGVLTVAVWKGNDKELEAKQKAFNAFKAANPDINVKMIFYAGDKVEAISRWSAAGDMPDIILTDAGEIATFAEADTIKPIDTSKFSANHQHLAGLVANALAPAFGKIVDGKFITEKLKEAQTTLVGGAQIHTTADQTSKDAKAWGLVKDFSTLTAYINKDKLTSTGTVENLATGNTGLKEFIDVAKTNLENNGKNSKGGANGIIGTTNDLARWISFANKTNLTGATVNSPIASSDETLYSKYKDKDGDFFKVAANQKQFKKDLIKLADQEDVKAMWDAYKSGEAVSPNEHKYGWNGEGFDNGALASTVEGNWYTPSDPSKVEVMHIDGFSGLYASTYALTNNLNDEAAAYKFLEYMTWGEGAKIGTQDMGLMSPSTQSLKEVYQMKDSSSDSFEKQSFSEHLKAVEYAVANVYTHIQGTLFGAWGDIMKASTSSDDLATVLGKVADKFFVKLGEE